MYKKILGLLLLSLTWVGVATAQLGGTNSFNFVRLPVNAHLAAIGGENISVQHINTIGQNPALIDKAMSKQFAISYLPYYADIKTTSLAYVHDLGKYGPLAVGLQYYSSGAIPQKDEQGNDLGTYAVNQYYATVATSHTVNYYTLGVNLKVAGSTIGTYSSYATMMDIGGVFKHPTRDFRIGLVAKNIGFVMKQYADTKATLPFELQLGTTYKLEHMPLRFSLLLHHLNQFDIVYLDPYAKQSLDANGVPLQEKKSFGDKLMRHVTIGGEFLLGKTLSVNFGYNHLVRREMKNEARSGMAGFSLGVMFSTKKFNLAYARSWQHVAGGYNSFTLNVKFSEWLTKKTVPVAE